MNRQIHLIIPFYRHENKKALIETYKPMRIILHPIMFQDEEVTFNETWIKPLIIPMNTGDCPAEMIECFKRNWFIKNSEIVDEDYYVTVDDDDMYEDGVFDAVKDIDEDIVIISMKRGFNIPDNVGELRQHPNDTLWAHPDNVSPGRISGQQSFVKGSIFKLHLFNESSNIWDGEMATYHKETKTIRYEPDLFALFNYYEPGRWIKKENNLTSIIIPVYNQHEMTDECIRLLDETVSEYELIVIDNGSDPFYTPRDPATGFRYHENRGFPIAVNQGVGIAKGENIVVLNNDTMVTPDAINRLIKWLDVYDIVGPVTNYSAGIQQVQIPIYKDMNELNKVARTYMEENRGQSEAARFIIGFCMVFKRTTFNHIGAFDDSLWPCSGEEIDFCLRSHQKGYKIGIARDVYVHHIGSCTIQDLESAGQINCTEVFDRNDKHLAQKWGDDFWQKQLIQGETG